MPASIHPIPLRSFIEPDARPDQRRPVPARPQHVELEVRLDPAKKSVSGRVTHRVEILGDAVRSLPLDATDMVVHSAACDGDACRVVTHADGVDVVLGRALKAGEQVELTLTFEAEPSLGLFFVDGPQPQAWTQGAMEDHHHWFPCFDAPEHMVTTAVTATVPEPCIALSNGEPAEWAVEVEPGWRRFAWRHDTPHALYLLTLVVDDLACVEDRSGPVPLFHYVPHGREDDARALFARVSEMIEYIGRATGCPYPYGRYGHVFLRSFMWGGMENTTLTSLTDNALVDQQYVAEEELERLVAHELAHQWFGDLIAPRGWPQIWLNESFATYFDMLTIRAIDGEDAFFSMLAGYRGAYLEEAGDRYARPIVTRTYVHPYVLFDRHAYEKGALTLHTLRDQLGEHGFWTGLRLYVKRCTGTAAETADLRRAFEDATGADLTDFFEQFIYQAGHAKLTVRWRWRPRVGVELELERSDDGAQCLDVPVAIAIDGEVVVHRVPVGPESRLVILPSAHPPVWLAVDPEAHCLVELDESSETDDALKRRLDPAQAPIALRMRTARLLGKRGTPRSTAALARTLVDDPAWVVRVEAAAALGAHRSDAARAKLLDAAREDPSWRVRAAAGSAVGQGADAGWVKTLDGLLADEQSPRVRSALIKGVGAIRDPAAAAVLRRHLDRPSPRDRIAAAAIGGLAAQDDLDAVDELLLRAEPGHPRGVRRAALSGLARLGRHAAIEHKDRRRIREAVEARLGDSVFHVRIAAVRAARSLGDVALRPALERAHGAERFEIVRRIIREALGALDAAVKTTPA